MVVKIWKQLFKENLRHYLLMIPLLLLAEGVVAYLINQSADVATEAYGAGTFIGLIILVFFASMLQNLSINRIWRNHRFRLLPATNTQLYFAVMSYLFIVQLIFAAVIIASWLGIVYSLDFSANWPGISEVLEPLGSLLWSLLGLNVLWQLIVLVSAGASEIQVRFGQSLLQTAAGLLVVFIQIGSTVLFGLFFKQVLGFAIDDNTPFLSPGWWGSMFLDIFWLVADVTVSIYFLNHYVEGERRSRND